MFGQGQWKNEIIESVRQLELQVNDLKKNDLELKAQNVRLLQIIKNIGRKLVSRLPISLESLDKGLNYDLIFPEEVETWRVSVEGGVLLDTRASHEFTKASIPGAYNIPFDQLAARSESLLKDRPILLVCENGIKSVAACELLSGKGYFFLYVLKGGMSLYRGQIVREADVVPMELDVLEPIEEPGPTASV
ncbi:MAG: phage shock protein [Bacteriovoracaceae bacterium]|nr:phage shock protein [Bacteriovoracaceae bacterium]